MNKLIILTIVAALLTVTGGECADFNEYVIDPLEEESLNYSFGYSNHTPAGKYGKVYREGADLKLTDTGETIRFWGCNTSYASNFPEKYFAHVLADDLYRFGINILRTHHKDSHYYNQSSTLRGIWTDATFSEISTDSLDLYHYFLYQLKERGIYWLVPLWDQRSLYDNESNLLTKNQSKAIAFFDKDAIQKQKDFANTFLTTENPYTGLSILEDPACAFIEIINEASLIHYFYSYYLDVESTNYVLPTDAISEYYTDQLDVLWNTFLEEKYTDVAGVKSAWGITDLTESTMTEVETHDEAWSLLKYGTAEATSSYLDGVATVETTALGAENWYVMYAKTNQTIDDDKVYKAEFTVSSDVNQTIGFAVQQGESPFATHYSSTFSVTSTPASFVKFFKADFDDAAARFQFFCGYEVGTITITNLTISEGDYIDAVYTQAAKEDFTYDRVVGKEYAAYPQEMQDDNIEFLQDVSLDYYASMSGYLTESLGCDKEITIMNWSTGHLEEQHVISKGTGFDVYDTHTYWDHPRFPNVAWDTSDWTYSNASLFSSDSGSYPEWTFPYRLEAYYTDKDYPMIVTEWNHCYPNDYAYEGPPMMAFYGNDLGYDAMFKYAYSHSRMNNTANASNLDSFFDFYNNPQQRLLMGVGSVIYQDNTVTALTTSDTIVISGDKVFGATGNIGGETYDNGDFTISPDISCSSYICSLDGLSLTSAKKLGLVTVARVLNTNADFTYGSITFGSAPTLLEDTQVAITLPTPATGFYVANEVLENGRLGEFINITDSELSTNKHFVLIRWFNPSLFIATGSGSSKMEASGNGKATFSSN